MTKTDLVKALAKAPMENVKLTQNEATEVINTVLELITEGLKADGIVQITGFGTFKARTVEERMGHNPKNPAEKIVIPARKQPSFTSGAQLKKDLNA